MDKIIKYLEFELNDQMENYAILVRLQLSETAKVEENNIAVLKDLINIATNGTGCEFVFQFIRTRYKLSFDPILHWDPHNSCFNIVTQNKDLATRKPIYIPTLDPIKE